MQSLTRADVERLAIKGTHADFKWTRDGRTTMNYLNPKTGGTESWDVTSLPTEHLHTKIRIFVRYVGAQLPKLAGMEGQTDGQEDADGYVLVRWATRIGNMPPTPDRELIHVGALKEIRKLTRNFI